MAEKLISLVIPVYNEAAKLKENIACIYSYLTPIIEKGKSFEVILVDDGSRDKTWEVIKSLQTEGTRTPVSVHGIRLSRNFGKEAALCAGLIHTRGDACIIMDSDLQHPPSMIPEMIELWEEGGYNVIEGIKESRGKESAFYKLGAVFFYKVLEKFAGFNINGASDFKLVDSKVLTAWKSMQEHNTFFRGMSTWVGFERKQIPFVVAPRSGGETKWPIRRLVSLAINAITSFSSVPLQLVTFIGTLFFAGSIILGIQTLYKKAMGIAFSGFTTVILLLLITGSALMISLGIIGTYIAKIYDEVKSRPRYIIMEEINNNASDTTVVD